MPMDFETGARRTSTPRSASTGALHAVNIAAATPSLSDSARASACVVYRSRHESVVAPMRPAGAAVLACAHESGRDTAASPLSADLELLGSFAPDWTEFFVTAGTEPSSHVRVAVGGESSWSGELLLRCLTPVNPPSVPSPEQLYAELAEDLELLPESAFELASRAVQRLATAEDEDPDQWAQEMAAQFLTES